MKIIIDIAKENFLAVLKYAGAKTMQV